jgi:hypothetical protein
MITLLLVGLFVDSVIVGSLIILFVLLDRVIVSYPEDRQYYTEKFIIMPHTFFVSDHAISRAHDASIFLDRKTRREVRKTDHT